jgi:tetratricopeptide (TPR) repeat protein
MKLFLNETLNSITQKYLVMPFLFIMMMICSLYGGIIWNGIYWVQIAFLITSFLFILFAFFARRRERYAKLPRIGIEWMTVLFLLVIISSWILSPLPRQGTWRIASIIGYFSLLYVLTDLFANGFDAKGYLNLLMVVVGFFLFSAVLETFLAYQSWFTAVASYKIFPPVIYRFGSLLGHSNALMAAANLLAPIALINFAQSKKFLQKFLYIFWFFLFMICFVFCSSRGSYAGLLTWIGVLSIYFLFFHRSNFIQKHRKIIFITLGILAIIFIVGVLVFGSYLVTHPSHGSGLLSSREEMWADALKIWRNHPWFGAGPGRIPFEILKVNSAIPPNYFPNHVHSTWLQILAEFGIFGFLTFLFINYQAIKTLIVQWINFPIGKKIYGMAFLASFAGFFIQSILDNFTNWVFIIFIFISLVAMYLALIPEKVKIWREVNLRAIFIPIGIVLMAGMYSIWAQIPFRQGVSAYEKGDYQKSAELITSSFTRDPYSSYLYTQAGLAWSKVWQQTGEDSALRKARQYLGKSVSLEGSPAYLWADLAILEWYAGNHNQGLEYIRHAIEINDKEASNYLIYGYFLELTNDNVEANLAYRKVAEMVPSTCSHPFWQETKLRRSYACDVNDTFLPFYTRQAAEAINAAEYHQASIDIQNAKWMGEDQIAIDTMMVNLAKAQGQTNEAESLMEQILAQDILFDNYIKSPLFHLIISRWVNHTKGLDFILVPGYMQVSPDYGQYGKIETYISDHLDEMDSLQQESMENYLFRARNAGALPASIE